MRELLAVRGRLPKVVRLVAKGCCLERDARPLADAFRRGEASADHQGDEPGEEAHEDGSQSRLHDGRFGENTTGILRAYRNGGTQSMGRFALVVGAALVVVGVIAASLRLTLGMESAQHADSLKFSETNSMVRFMTTVRADQHGSIFFLPSKDVFGNSEPVGLVPITPGGNGTGTEGIANPGAHEVDE
ncbi:hypothetical protein EPN42_13160, partial [bacterium]